MNKQIILKLNKLKEVKPDLLWKEKNKELLLSQISAQQGNEAVSLGLFNSLFKNLVYEVKLFIAEPVALVVFLLLLIISPVVASGFIDQSNPGDSLYIAKIVSEKAQLAITFDEVKKAQLSVGFAQSRTEEIARVIDMFDESVAEKDLKVQKLTEDFKSEINRIKTYKVVSKSTLKDDVKVVDTKQVQVAKLNNAKKTINNNSEKDYKIFSANSNRDAKGIEFSDGSSKTNLNKALDDANSLMDKKDYVGILNKLDEVSALLEKANQQDDKVSQVASSSNDSKIINNESKTPVSDPVPAVKNASSTEIK
ncbi:MAG: DUF5667 domain-containing protein [Candidatus Falkowbacteria bacterium]|nr:DUF5667 domain-containing protein [Candidatus Falkowbacteria bacterium]